MSLGHSRGHCDQYRSNNFLSWAFCKDSFSASCRLSCLISLSSVETSSEKVIGGKGRLWFPSPYSTSAPGSIFGALNLFALVCSLTGRRLGGSLRSSARARSGKSVEGSSLPTASPTTAGALLCRSLESSLGAPRLREAAPSAAPIGAATAADVGTDGARGNSPISAVVLPGRSAALPRDAKSSKNFHGVFMMRLHPGHASDPSM
ncbi:hypothetical protein D9M69_131370 [compost metagenome]